MSIAIVHLSDIHLSQNNNIAVLKKSEIANTICNNVKECDHTFIITSGDIAFSGKNDEYDLAIEFYGELEKKLKESQICFDFLFVPGNHDCNFEGDLSVRNLILDGLNNDETKLNDSVLNHLAATQFNFSNFNSSVCTMEPIFDNNIVKIYASKIKEQSYNFFMFNTSLFSKKREDIGVMKLPYEFSKAITDKITVAPDDINIIAMHHPFHWNDNDTYKDIKNYIESMANYLFLGHEHVYDSNYKRTKDGRNVNTFEGRLFSNKNILDGFGLIKIDNNNVTKKVFSWITECFEEIENSSYQVENSKNGVHLSDKMMHFIDKMELIPNIEDKTTLSDLFVSPLIFKYANEDEKFKIDTDEILKGTFDKKYIIIRADDKYGKTSLLKMIMKARYQQGKYPVFIDGKELIYSKIKDCSILAKKFEEQYENKSAGFYNSLDRNKKIVLIDDMDGNLRQSDFLPFLMNLSDLVDEIFVTVSSEFSDMLTWKNKQGTQFNTKFERWELVKWNNSKKLDLFQKWFSFNNMEMDVQRIEKLENSLDIPFQKGIMPVTPFYILSALYLEKNGISLSGISPESMCAEFYRAIITLSLLKVGVNNQKINQCFNYIEYIAYAIFNSDIKEISPDGLKNIHDDYIRKKNISTIPISTEKLIEANILTKFSDSFKFSFDYMYYFFVAKYFSENLFNNYNANETKILQSKIEKLFTTLYERDAANIVVFMSYHMKSPFIIECIKAKADDLIKFFNLKTDPALNAWEDVGFVDSLIDKVPEIMLPTKKEMELKKEEIELRDKKELEIKKANNNYDEIEKNIIEALKISEIIGCLLKNHVVDLDRTPKMELCKKAYLLHRSITHAYISILKREKDIVLSYIEEQLEKSGKTQDREMIHRESQNIVFFLVGGMYLSAIHHISVHMANSDLMTTHKELCEEKELYTKFMNIINFYNKMVNQAEFPLSDLTSLIKGLSETSYLFNLITKLVVTRFVAFRYSKISRNIKDTIFSLLKIPEKKQTQLLVDYSKEKQAKDKKVA